jgi:hypothetical protein
MMKGEGGHWELLAFKSGCATVVELESVCLACAASLGNGLIAEGTGADSQVGRWEEHELKFSCLAP